MNDDKKNKPEIVIVMLKEESIEDEEYEFARLEKAYENILNDKEKYAQN